MGYKKYIVGSAILLTVLIVLLVQFKFKKSTSEEILATSTSSSVSSKADWESGSLTNVDSTTSAGSIKLDNKNSSPIDLYSIYQADNSRITATLYPNDAYKAIDGDTGTRWTLYHDMNNQQQTWQMNLAGSYTTAHIRYVSTIALYDIFLSSDAVNWGSDLQPNCVFDVGNNWHDCSFESTAFQYIKFILNQGQIPDEAMIEFYVYGNATATHTSTATQIDGTESGTKNFIEWETFTPTYSEPASTNVKFRFRTSADAVTWTSWSAYQTPASGNALDISAIVDSGIGAKKYLQVETTLENTDGVSTPTLDSYSVTYHTDTKPDKPTAQTATVQ